MKGILILSLMFISGLGMAQGNTINAKVVSTTNNAIEFANFVLLDKDSSVVIGCYSNSRGIIQLDGVGANNYIVKISAFGYFTRYLELDFVNRINIDLGELVLRAENSQEIDEVEIIVESSLLNTSFDKRVYNINDDLTAQGGRLTDVLNNLPSVEVDNDGNISLRGNSNVTVLIDGRASALSQGSEGALDAIPSSAVERIELVTNPSAKYDPDGTAGIINIVLKKNKLRGLNLITDLTGATGNLVNGGLNFNVRTERLNLFSSYSYRHEEGYRNNYNNRTTFYDDSTVNLLQEREGTDTRISHTGKIGMDFFINPNHVIGISLSGSYNERTRTGDQLNYESFNDSLNRYWNRLTYDPRFRRNIDFKTDYKWDFVDEKGNFIFLVNHSTGNNNSIGRFEEFYYNPDGSFGYPDYLFQNQQGDQLSSNLAVSADLTKVVSEKIKIESGLKWIRNREFRSNYLEYYDTLTGLLVPDLNVNNEFEFDEDILAWYGMFGSQPFQKMKYQLGMRLEQAFTFPRLLTTNEEFENNYFSYFPSAHLIYEPKKENEFSISYSRRINRPDVWNLNPFPVYDDPLNLRTGNPQVKPEYINSIEGSFLRESNKFTFTSSVYYRQTVDKIQRVREFFTDGRSITSFANVDESYDYGIELIGNYSPFSWWKNTLSFNGNERILSATINGLDLRNRGFSWNVKWNSSFSLFENTTTIQLNAQYVSLSYAVQGTYRRRTGIDLAINRVFFDKKLSVGMRVTDIFNTMGFELLFTQGNTIQESNYKWLTRRFYLTLSYRFGRMDDKKSGKNGDGKSGGDEF